MSERTNSRAGAVFPVQVEEDPGGIPVSVRMYGWWATVASVEARQDVMGSMMGEERVVKTCFEVVLANGGRVEVFRNHVTGSWYHRM